MKNRDMAREIARQPDSQEDWTEYRSQRNKCSKKLEETKKNIF